MGGCGDPGGEPEKEQRQRRRRPGREDTQMVGEGVSQSREPRAWQTLPGGLRSERGEPATASAWGPW